MTREWALYAYKARLDSAIGAERWDEVDRVRVAAKRRLLEMVADGGSEAEITAARDALADSFDRLRLSKRLRIDKGALTTAIRLSADAETAGIAAEQAPLPQDTARDIKERIVQILSSGNRRPWTTSELAHETAKRVETVARAVSQLRAERKIISRRMGRHVLHRAAEPQRETLTNNLSATAGSPVDKKRNLIPLPNSEYQTCFVRSLYGGKDAQSLGLSQAGSPVAFKTDVPPGIEPNINWLFLGEDAASPAPSTEMTSVVKKGQANSLSWPSANAQAERV